MSVPTPPSSGNPHPPLNRAQRRRASRAGKRWLAAVAADPRTSHEELQVARAIAEHATPDGRITLTGGGAGGC